jgi:DNA-binding IclR family transcriptional regulator
VASAKLPFSEDRAGATDKPARRDGVQVVARVAQVLRCLSSEPDGLTLSELSVRTGLARSTAHRLIAALAEEGFVEIAPHGLLFIGPALVRIVVTSGRDLRQVVAPYLERLSREVHETVDLAVLDDGHVLFIDHHTARRDLRVVAEIGARLPLHSTASGKALLAALAPDEVNRLLPKRLTRATANTITNRRALLAELAQAGATGLAYDREEQTAGIAAIGTAVRVGVGGLVAITVVLPVARLALEEKHIVAALLRLREEMQSNVGAGRPSPVSSTGHAGRTR